MNLRHSLRRRGVIDTLRLLFLRVFNVRRTPAFLIARKVDLERYDRDHRIETSGVIELDHLDIDSPNREHGTRYGGTSPWVLKEALSKVPIDHSNYAFVDIGSGKGGVLFQASDYPFREIIGVEFAPSLHAVALRNLASFRSRTQRCRRSFQFAPTLHNSHCLQDLGFCTSILRSDYRSGGRWRKTLPDRTVGCSRAI